MEYLNDDGVFEYEENCEDLIAPGLRKAIEELKQYFEKNMIPKSINRVILPKVYITKDRFEDLISDIFIGKEMIDYSNYRNC